MKISLEVSRPTDSYKGLSFDDVLRSRKITDVGISEMSSGRLLEHATALPSEPDTDFNPCRRIVQLPFFPNTLTRRSWGWRGFTRVPNQIALRALAVADQANIAVSAFGQPFRYNHEERARATSGDYSDIAQDIVENLISNNVTSTIVYGFSEGGSFAPDVTLALLEAGVNVEGVVIGSTPNADDQRGALKLAANFIDMKALKEIQQAQEVSPAHKESAVGRALGNRALHLAKVVGVDTIGFFATIGSRIVRPTSIAFGRGFAYGKWLSNKSSTEIPQQAIESKILKIMEHKPDLKITFFTAENDKIGTPHMMKRMMQKCGFSAEELTIFEGLGHGVGDNISATSAFIGSLVRQLNTQTD